MLYVEWLRVRGAIKWTAIVLGALFLIAAVVRIAIIGKQDYLAWAFNLKADPGAKVSDTLLPDGTHHITIDDPAKKIRVVIDDRGYSGKHMEVYDYSGHSTSEMEHSVVSMGSVKVSSMPNGHGTLTVVDSNGETSFRSYLIGALMIALIVATMLGAPFARENDGHLELTLTKPIDRVRFAAGAIGVDVLGILAVLAIGIVFEIVVQAMFEVPKIAFDARTAGEFAACVVAPLAWYAMLTAATASFKRGWGVVLGFAWPVALVVIGLSVIEPQGNPLLIVIRDVGSVLAAVDPLSYMHFGSNAVVATDNEVAVVAPQVTNDLFHAGMLAFLAVLYSLAAIVQWRRIEA